MEQVIKYLGELPVQQVIYSNRRAVVILTQCWASDLCCGGLCRGHHQCMPTHCQQRSGEVVTRYQPCLKWLTRARQYTDRHSGCLQARVSALEQMAKETKKSVQKLFEKRDRRENKFYSPPKCTCIAATKRRCSSTRPSIEQQRVAKYPVVYPA